MQEIPGTFRPIFRYTLRLGRTGLAGPIWELECYPGHLIGLGYTYREAKASLLGLIRWTVEEDGWDWFRTPESLRA